MADIRLAAAQRNPSKEPATAAQIEFLETRLERAEVDLRALKRPKARSGEPTRSELPLVTIIWLSGLTLMALGLGGGLAWMFFTQKKVGAGSRAPAADQPVLTNSAGWSGFGEVRTEIDRFLTTISNERNRLHRTKHSVWEAWYSSLTSSIAKLHMVTLGPADAGSLKSLARTIRGHTAVIVSVPKAKAVWTGTEVQKAVDDLLRWCDQKAEELAKTPAAASQNPNAGYGELIGELEGIHAGIQALEARLQEHDSKLGKLEARVEQYGSMGAVLEAEFARQCAQRAQELQTKIEARKRTLTQAPPAVVTMALKAAGDAAQLGAQATLDGMLHASVKALLSRLAWSGSEIAASNPVVSTHSTAAPSVAPVANLPNEPQARWSADLLNRGSLERAQSAYWVRVNQLLEDRVRPIQEWLDDTAGDGDDSSELRVRDWLVSRVLPFLDAARLVLHNSDVQHEVRTRGNQTVRTAMQSLDSSFRHLLQGAGGLFEVEHVVGQAVPPGPRVSLEEGDRSMPAGTILEIRETAILWGDHLLRPARLLVQKDSRVGEPAPPAEAPAPSRRRPRGDVLGGKLERDDAPQEGTSPADGSPLSEAPVPVVEPDPGAMVAPSGAESTTQVVRRVSI